MVPYVIVLMMIITFYIFAELTIGGHKINHRFARGIVFLTLWLIAGLRYNVGRDFANYLREFNFFLYGRVSWIDFEPGYRLLSSAIALFTTNAQYLFLVTSFITLWFVFKAIDKHSESFYLSLFLFVAMYFYFNSFNEVRHYMAVSISFYGTRYLAKRDFTKYAITIVIASLFHYSALIMLFAYFFVTRNYRRTTYLMAIGIAVLIRILYFRIIPIVAPLIPRYANYLYYYREGSSATLSVVIAGLIFCIACFNRKKLSEKNQVNIYYANAVLFSVVLNLLASVNIMFFRVGLYFYIYCILLIPALIGLVDNKYLKFVIREATVLVFIVYLLYLLINNVASVVPYTFNPLLGL